MWLVKLLMVWLKVRVGHHREKQDRQSDGHHGDSGDCQPDIAAKINEAVFDNTLRGYVFVIFHVFLYCPTARSETTRPPLIVTTRRLRVLTISWL